MRHLTWICAVIVLGCYHRPYNEYQRTPPEEMARIQEQLKHRDIVRPDCSQYTNDPYIHCWQKERP